MREGNVGNERIRFLPPVLLHGDDSDESRWAKETLLLLGDRLLMLAIGEWIRFSDISSSISSVIVSILECDNKLMSGFLMLYIPEEDDPIAPWWKWDCGGSSLLLDESGSWASGCLKTKVNKVNQELSINGYIFDCFKIVSLPYWYWCWRLSSRNEQLDILLCFHCSAFARCFVFLILFEQRPCKILCTLVK